ncbi:MAG: methyltransferase domain-containing protein [Pseudomonadota bacterium]
MIYLRNIKDKIEKNFSKAAETYHNHAHIQADIAGQLSELSRNMQNITDIIDIGCGTGFLTQRLRKIFPKAHITACDMSAPMLEECARHSGDPKMSYLKCDAELYDFPQKYDLIASNMTFQWFSDLQASHKHLLTYLKPGGKILFSMLIGKTFYEWYDSLSLAGVNITSPIRLHDVPTDFEYDLLQRELYVQNYERPMDFLKMLKKIGAHSMLQENAIQKQQLEKACRIFQEKYNCAVTYDIVLAVISAGIKE